MSDEHLTGPGHFRQAEALLTAAAVQAESAAQELGDEDDRTDPLLVLLRAVAQLSAANTHAVLALAAATAALMRRVSTPQTDLDIRVAAEWREALQ